MFYTRIHWGTLFLKTFTDLFPKKLRKYLKSLACMNDIYYFQRRGIFYSKVTKKYFFKHF